MKSAAQGMSSQLVFASFLIALISFVNPRVRPGGHGTGGVVHVPCFLGSSMLLLTIVLNYAPYREFHFIVFILAALDQMAIGNMYLSDCLMGVFFGILMNKFNPSEISITLYLILMFGSMFFWFPASAIVSTALPVILSSSMIRIRKEFCWISFLKFLFFEGLKKIVNISTEYETFIFDIISSALSLYLVQVASDFNSFRSSVGSSFRETFHKFGF
ncbi:hypothetical protein GPJ56_004866 [Histomonas meleagridis]|uniref:uncharacterized protein n=1 Tax=Histomonas meleagridis TaxID=135588 RepID=UPI00355AAF1E|nr:hypothetical protein GPJ56_004866 [Histomonas meleagridis]KAH0803516.1 hypothetical protein GO595_003860 [Histomonas meleagridis]